MNGEEERTITSAGGLSKTDSGSGNNGKDNGREAHVENESDYESGGKGTGPEEVNCSGSG